MKKLKTLILIVMSLLATSHVVAEIPQTPVTASTDAAKTLYSYFLEQYGKKTISSVMADVNWNNNCAEKVKNLTGKYPAMNCYDFIHICFSPANWIDYTNIKPVQDWHEAGGIVQLMWHFNVPKKEGDSDVTCTPSETTFNASNALKSGTWENKWFYEQMDKVVASILKLQDAGIAATWRPFHEAAGNATHKQQASWTKSWFWWGADGAETYKKLWTTMYDYFKQKGIKNLIWVWTTQNYNGNSADYNQDTDWYPGDQYVDIVGRDLYGCTADQNSQEFKEIQECYPNKMVVLAECGNGNNNDPAKMGDAWAKGAKWGHFMVWYQGGQGSTDTMCSDSWWKNAMSDANVITRDQLPNLIPGAVVFESATDAVKNMGVGWNLGNTLEANNQNETDMTKAAYWGQQDLTSETCWQQFVTKPELMKMFKEAGFGAIRVPVTWYNHMDSEGNVDAAWMKRVHEVVDYVISQGMYCIINVHHDTGADGNNYKSWLKADTNNYSTNKSRYENLWKQIANEFQDYDEKLLFESYNEMLDPYNSWNFASWSTSGQYDAGVALKAYNAINNYAQCFVDVVRATGGNNAQRNLIVNTYGACNGSGTWNTHLSDPLTKMKLPNGETNHIIFEVHAYPNIENLSSAKTGVDNMISTLKDKLVSKGAPVIFGEWGTSNVDAGAGKTDYDVRRSSLLDFVDYFVKKTKENGMATFYWMGLSDGMSRLYPAFDQADLAKAIVQAWHGTGFNPVLPEVGDFGESSMSATVNYTNQWAELNLFQGSISSADYKSLQIELQSAPGVGAVQFKVYDSNKTQDFSQASSTLVFTSAMGTITRITLQWKKATEGSVRVKSVWLIKKDGTKVPVTISPYWGCSMTDVDVSTGISDIKYQPMEDDAIYNLNGQRVQTPTRGIYIRNGKKYIQR